MSVDDATGEMTERRAVGIPMRVVSAKLPEHWIVRGIRCFASIDQVRDEVLNFVGRLDNAAVEWSTYEYHLPSYLVFPSGDLHALGTWPAGVYLHRYLGGDVYGDGSRMDLVGASIPQTAGVA